MMLTGRGCGFPDGIEKNYLTKINLGENRKRCLVSCTFFISGFLNNKPYCNYCEKGFDEK